MAKDNAAAIKAAKTPVNEYMAKRAAMLAAVDKLDAEAAPAVGNLIEVSGVSGPFRFKDLGDYTFRKAREGGTFAVNPWEDKPVIE